MFIRKSHTAARNIARLIHTSTREIDEIYDSWRARARGRMKFWIIPGYTRENGEMDTNAYAPALLINRRSDECPGVYVAALGLWHYL